MLDQNSRSSMKPAPRGFHARDLRLAGGISVGLVSAILVGGALLAPVANWERLSSSRGGDDPQIVHLADLPAVQHTPGGAGNGPASGPGTSAPGAGPTAAGP